MPNPVLESVTPPFVNFRFEVVLTPKKPLNGISSPICNAAFAECNGLDMTMQPESFNENGDNQRQTHLKGKVTYGQLTLNRGMTPNNHLWRWFEAAGTPGINARADGTITVFQPNGETAMVFKLSDCLPVNLRGPSLNARNGEIAIEELQLVYARLTLEGAEGAGGGGSLNFSAGFGVGVNASASASIGGGLSGGLSVSGGPGLSARASANASAGFSF